MTALIEGFKIVTEFAFDAGLASAEIGGIQGQIGKLSSGIDDLLYQAQNFGLNFAASFTGLGGGIIGIIGSAITASDQFNKAQLSFSNIMASNLDMFSGSITTFNDRMLASKNIIADIVKDSREFAIPAKVLLQTTEIIGGLTAPLGLTGTNFGTSRELSANYLKASRSMGLDPSQQMNQFVNIVTGHATQQGMLGQRLFKEVGIEDTEGNVLRTAKAWNKFFESDKINAIAALNKAMDRFTKNADELAGSTNTMSALFQKAKDLFFGFGSILKPLGDVILPTVSRYLSQIIDLVQKQGGNIVQTIANLIEPIVKAPEKFLIKLMQLKNLAGDIASAAGIASLGLMLTHLGQGLAFLGGSTILAGIGSFITSIPILGTFITFLVKASGAIGTFIVGAGGLVSTILNLSGVFAGLTIYFQAISRAFAKADIANFYTMVKNSDKFVELIGRGAAALEEIFRPIEVVIESLSELFLLFIPAGSQTEGFISILDILVSALELASSGVRQFLGGIMGFVHGLVEAFSPLMKMIAGIAEQGPIDYIKNLVAGGESNPFEGYGIDSIMSKMIEGYDKYSRPYLETKKGDKDKEVTQSNVNIGQVNQEFNIKHEVQPDRIAFTVKEQLSKLSKNSKSRKAGGIKRAAFSR